MECSSPFSTFTPTNRPPLKFTLKLTIKVPAGLGGIQVLTTTPARLVIRRSACFFDWDFGCIPDPRGMLPPLVLPATVKKQVLAWLKVNPYLDAHFCFLLL